MKPTPEVAGEVIAVMTAIHHDDYATASRLMKEHDDLEDLARGAFSMACAAINILAELLHLDPERVMGQLGLAAARAREEHTHE